MTWNRIRMFTALVFAFSGPAAAQTGHTDWGRWRFDWEVKDNTGLALRNVYYDGEEVLYKASMPVARVQYNRGIFDIACGPFADRIAWGNVRENPLCDNALLCQRSFVSEGRSWLEIGIYARLGKYHLYQSYYLSDEGDLETKLWSRGLQCHIDHRHHPYWRMDFDINGPNFNQIFVYGNRPDEGWGPGWHKYTNEFNDTKNPSTNRAWRVRDNVTGHSVLVYPGEFDGVADRFSRLDVGGRLYRWSEDRPWPYPAWMELDATTSAT